jgi:AAA ATPase domain
VVATDVVGREQELATVARLFDQRRAGPWVVIIEGDAGIGKTTLWEAALDLARDRSWRVLAARPAEAEVRFSYVAVRDLLGPLIDETIHGLPGPQRRAVETAFLRAEGRADAHAVSAGVLGMLRAVSASAPVVVGIDDLQWLDAASARVLLRLAVVRYWTESQPAGAACARQAAAEAAPGSLTLAEAHALVAQLSHHSSLEREAHARQAIDVPAGERFPGGDSDHDPSWDRVRVHIPEPDRQRQPQCRSRRLPHIPGCHPASAVKDPATEITYGRLIQITAAMATNRARRTG